MSGLDIEPIGATTLDDESFQRWLGETSPELFTEYLGLTDAARRTLLVRRFRALVAMDGADAHLARRGGRWIAVMGLERQSWDSRHFGVECARLSPYCIAGEVARETVLDVHHEMLAAAVEWARHRGIVLLQRRLLSERLSEIHALESLGFHQVDSVVTLAAPLEQVLRQPLGAGSGATFRAAVDADFDGLAALTLGAFPHSRFVNDRLLSPARGEALYVEWLRRAFENNAASATSAGSGDAGIVVAAVVGRVVGYAAYQIARPLAAAAGTRVATVELIAVDSAYRGLGIGQNLFVHVAGIVQAHGAEVLESSTWINARASMASNQKAGLRVREHLLTYHRHL
jgi:GNAT superfamily N-acetyltransferase